MNGLIQRLSQQGKPQLFAKKEIQKQPVQKQIQQSQQMQFESDDVDKLFNAEDFTADPDQVIEESKQQHQPKSSILGVTKSIKKQIKDQKTLVKKKLKPLGVREPWTENHKIFSISTPQKIEDPKSRKKYKIHICFITPSGNKKNCTIRFGDKKSEDYVDHHNKDKRSMTLLRLNRNNDSVLNPNYWRIWLLNTEDTIQQAWNNYISSADHNFLMM